MWPLNFPEFSSALGIRARAITRAAAGFERPPLKRSHLGSKMMTTIDHTPVQIASTPLVAGLGAAMGVVPWESPVGGSEQGVSSQGPLVALPSTSWEEVRSTGMADVFGHGGGNLENEKENARNLEPMALVQSEPAPWKAACTPARSEVSRDPTVDPADRKLRRKQLQMSVNNKDLQRHGRALGIPEKLLRKGQEQLAAYVSRIDAVRSDKTLGAAALYNILREHVECRPAHLQHLTHQGIADLTGVSKSAIQRTSHEMRG